MPDDQPLQIEALSVDDAAAPELAAFAHTHDLTLLELIESIIVGMDYVATVRNVCGGASQSHHAATGYGRNADVFHGMSVFLDAAVSNAKPIRPEVRALMENKADE